MTALIDAARRGRAWARRRGSAVGSVVAVRAQEPVVVLTYDDGPDPAGTRQVLDALAEHDATATFFVLLTRVRQYPTVLAEIIAAGHEIALHGPDHRRPTEFGRTEALRRLLDSRAELEDRAGRTVRWYRPPYGAQTLGTWRATRQAGLTPVMWSGTTWDWRDVGQDERVAKAMATVGGPGSILLAHDGFAGADDGAPDGGPTHDLDRYALTDRVLDGLAQRGLRGVSLGGALAAGARPDLAAWFSR
ncbi:polysaccharide deacetylase family protein [Luteipulveratus sp. YIM 133132]|uniref:polysaccharide deacetylase family protein n=1 Tax=Luteipulveratus flavus TaxID=3031728 RepID=UPI0023AF7B07|nr:polysaccharide deacetylase family protein [Luteipulveratus sp. YIM 133132]MDE9364325.1 polysaccharide deacetylase family protein [Luteipulveratus sp. YIM 133132]